MNFSLWTFFLLFTKATIVWHVLFFSPSLLWKCYKISRNSCANDSRATLRVLLLFFYIYIYVHVYLLCIYILFLFFTYNYVERAREKTSCKNVERVIPLRIRGTRDEYWRVLYKSSVYIVLLNSVNLFVPTNDYQIFIHSPRVFRKTFVPAI